jgi:hypothetical protein
MIAVLERKRTMIAEGRFEPTTFGYETLVDERPFDSVRLKWCLKVLSSFPNLSDGMNEWGHKAQPDLPEGGRWCSLQHKAAARRSSTL